MRTKFFLLLFAGSLKLFVIHASAEPLSLDTVLGSSLAHYPAIQAAVQKKYRREAELTRAAGAFE